MSSVTIAGNGFTEKTGEADLIVVAPIPWPAFDPRGPRCGGTRFELTELGLFDPLDIPVVTFSGAFTEAIAVVVVDADRLRFTTPTSPIATRCLVTITGSQGILWIREFTYTET